MEYEEYNAHDRHVMEFVYLLLFDALNKFDPTNRLNLHAQDIMDLAGHVKDSIHKAMAFGVTVMEANGNKGFPWAGVALKPPADSEEPPTQE